VGDNLIERELKVIGPGFAEGIAGSFGQIREDLSRAGQAFVDDPLGATGNYLKNHGIDFLAGAAITFINPRGKAAAMLAAWSMRSTIYSTLDAVQAAADPNADIAAVKSDYANAIKHEGTAILSALPMAMAGGIAGRGLANGTFGLNKGAIDYFKGDVTSAQVKSNLFNLNDNIYAPRKKVLVTDLDGTTFPMFDYLVPALRENISFIARQMKIPESEVASALGGQRVHPWVLETSRLARKFQGTPLEFETQIVRPFWEIMSRNRSEHLRAFAQVPETLARARADGVEIVALTNAPTLLALQRLQSTNLTPYIDRLYSVHPVEPPVSQVVHPSALEHGRALVASELNAARSGPTLHELPRSASKPDTGGMDAIMHQMGVRPKQMLFVGDSIWKDGLVGEARGIPFLWAKYGSKVPAGQREFLESLGRPANPPGANRAPNAVAHGDPPATVGTLSSYNQLLPYLRPHVNWHDIGLGTFNNLRTPPPWKPVLSYNLIPEEYLLRQRWRR
jgi:FMN phosphatase YigB (HAD superfamily)